MMMHPKIKEWISLYSDSYDPHGDALTFWFAIAETLHHYAEHGVPSDWEFRHSPITEDEEFDLYTEELMDAYLTPDTHSPVMTTSDLIYAGDILGRAVEILKAMGRSY